jgi:subtilisin family serine protease
MRTVVALLIIAGLCSALTLSDTAYGQRRYAGRKGGRRREATLKQIRRVERADLPDSVPGEILIQFKPGTTESDRERVRRKAGAILKERIETEPLKATIAEGSTGGLELVTLRRRARGVRALSDIIKIIEEDPAVQFAEPNFVYRHQQTISNDTRYLNGGLWGMYSDDWPTQVGPTGPVPPGTLTTSVFGTQAEESWAVGHTGSAEFFIGVVDTGIQFEHPDLRNNVWTNPFDPPGDANGDGNRDDDGNGRPDDLHGWDFRNDNNTIFDGATGSRVDGHGTHVAGTIGAVGGNGLGVVGVNWRVTIISGKFLGSNGKGTAADAIKAIDYLTDLKTRQRLNVVATNHSWSGAGFSRSLLAAIKRAARVNILCVAAASNEGVNNDVNGRYPANYDTTDTSDGTPSVGYDAVISVAAIGSRGGLASFSDFGRRTVDLGAPGVNILSTYPVGRFATLNGTSMATPHVTGAMALYASTHPGATAAQIKEAVLGSVTPTASLNGKTVTGGRLNVSAF